LHSALAKKTQVVPQPREGEAKPHRAKGAKHEKRPHEQREFRKKKEPQGFVVLDRRKQMRINYQKGQIHTQT